MGSGTGFRLRCIASSLRGKNTNVSVSYGIPQILECEQVRIALTRLPSKMEMK